MSIFDSISGALQQAANAAAQQVAAGVLSIPGRSGQYDWNQAHHLPQPGAGSITFVANAHNDVHVAISSHAATQDPMYEIVIGGWGNTQSVIRRKSQGPSVQTAAVGLSAPGGANPLWVTLDKASKTLQVGRGALGTGVILTLHDPQFLADVAVVAFSSWDTPIQYSQITCAALATPPYLNWMSQTPGIEHKTLRTLCLPATHDSGTCPLTRTLATTLYSYDFAKYLYPNLDVDWALDHIDTRLPGFLHTMVKAAIQPLQPVVNATIADVLSRWSQATGLDISGQLSAGARYLDLRVGATSSGELRTFHGFNGPLLSDILTQLHDFLARTSGEVVVVQASHMDSLSPAQHAAFTAQIESTLGSYLFPYDDRAQLTEVPIGTITHASNGAVSSRVVFLYNDGYYSTYQGQKHGAPVLLWPASSYQTTGSNWQDSVATMDGLIARERAPLVASASAVGSLAAVSLTYTPDTVDVVPTIVEAAINALHIPGVQAGSSQQSLQGVALAANQRLWPLLMGLQASDRAKINILSCDFVESSYTIPVAVALSRGEGASLPGSPPYTLPPSNFTPHMGFSLTLSVGFRWGFSLFAQDLSVGVTAAITIHVDGSSFAQSVTFTYSAFGSDHTTTPVSWNVKFQDIADVESVFSRFGDDVKKFFTSTLAGAASTAIAWVKNNVIDNPSNVAKLFLAAGANAETLAKGLASEFSLHAGDAVKLVTSDATEAAKLLKDGFNWAAADVGNFLKSTFSASTVNSALSAAGYAADQIHDFMHNAFSWFPHVDFPFVDSY